PALHFCLPPLPTRRSSDLFLRSSFLPKYPAPSWSPPVRYEQRRLLWSKHPLMRLLSIVGSGSSRSLISHEPRYFYHLAQKQIVQDRKSTRLNSSHVKNLYA